MNVVQKPLRWHNNRPAGTVIDTIVMHASGGSTFSGAFRTLLDRELSYHYLIQDQREVDGEIVKCVDTSKRAWHAGKSFGPQGSDCNDYSIGISLINLNNGLDPYSEKQFSSAAWLIGRLREAIPTIKYLTTHAIVSPGRKTDPYLFPIRVLAAEVGLELWQPNR